MAAVLRLSVGTDLGTVSVDMDNNINKQQKFYSLPEKRFNVLSKGFLLAFYTKSY
jgi:hypothetical protein